MLALVAALVATSAIGVLLADPATNAVPSAGRIYFTAGGQEIDSNNPGTIQRVDANGTNLTTLINLPAGSNPKGIQLDEQNGLIYWNDSRLKVTQRADINGGNITTIQTETGRGLNHLALDVAGNKIYTTSGIFIRRVNRFNLDGTGSFQIIAQGTSTVAFFPHGIALDLANSHVFYGDPGIVPTGIRRMDLDGANNIQLINPNVFPPTNGCGFSGNPRHGRGRGMALDLANNKMYFAGHPRLPDFLNCPAGLGEIWVADLSGANLQLLISGLEKVTDVELDLGAGKIYWADARAGKIQRANLDGSNVEDVLTNVLTPFGIAIEPAVVTCDDLLISDYDPIADHVELANVGGAPISIDACSFVTYDVATELSIGAATTALSGVLAPGETLDLMFTSSMPDGPGGIAVLDAPPPPGGTPVGDVLIDVITGMVYIDSTTVFGVSHLAVPAHNTIYDCIYGGHGTGPFPGPFPVGTNCLP